MWDDTRDGPSYATIAPLGAVAFSKCYWYVLIIRPGSTSSSNPHRAANPEAVWPTPCEDLLGVGSVRLFRPSRTA